MYFTGILSWQLVQSNAVFIGIKCINYIIITNLRSSVINMNGFYYKFVQYVFNAAYNINLTSP